MTRSRRSGHRLVGLVGLLAAMSSTAVAQQPRTSFDPARPQIRRVLRAFYFNFARRDWEALTAGILPAKVVAHHPAPPAIAAASDPHGLPANCPPTVAERVEGAEITIEGGWAAASVARCNAGDIGIGAVGRDDFRFIDLTGAGGSFT